ncbi:MAG: DinB family protein [Chloroflexota bacterium]
MNIKNYFLQLHGYNGWANQLILKTAQDLTEEQFEKNTTHSHGSFRDTLYHNYGAEWFWRERMQGGPSTAFIEKEEFSDLNTIKTYYSQEANDMKVYIDSLAEDDFSKEFIYKNSKGDKHSQIISDILTHVVVHGMQHRSELAIMLTGYGHSPGNIDFVVYTQEL